jgi:acetylornithine deacetylase/succinyl-diaminopimelate desuccinylase-like protein
MFELSPHATKADLLQEINRAENSLAELCADMIRCGAGSAPSDTRRCIAVVAQLMGQHGIPFEIEEPQPGLQSLLAIQGSAHGPTVVLNAHLDVFPADDATLWTYAPFSGKIEDGRIYGRGACDMKAGAASSITAFLLLASLAPRLRGRLVLMLVADEETGGHWGTDYLLRTRDDLHADACLIGEPSGTRALRVGEKGQLWLELSAQGASYHSGLANGDEPIFRVARAISLLHDEFVGRPGRIPSAMTPVIENSRRYAWVPEFAGRQWVLDHISVNVGTIEGGIRTNIAPRDCRASVDIRLPFGIEPDALTGEIKELFAKANLDVVVSPLLHTPYPATFTDPDDPLIHVATRNIEQVVGCTPDVIVNPTFTDARFFRIRGYPTVVFGPTPYGMAQPDEYVTVEDLLTTAKVHAGTAWDLLVEDPQ